MATSTSRLGLLQPVGADPASELRVAITTNATLLDPSMRFFSGTLANRGTVDATPILGDSYYATDAGLMYMYNGSGWTQLGAVGSGYGNLSYVYKTSGPVTALLGQLIGCNGSFTVNLPTPTLNGIVGVVNIVGGAITITAPSGLIYAPGSAAASYHLNTSGFLPVLFQSDGTNWLMVSNANAVGPIPRIPNVSVSASPGDVIVAAPSTTISLPSANGALALPITITAEYNVTSTTPVTVSDASGDSGIFGTGLSGVTSFLLGSPGANVTLMPVITGWNIVAGQQDTGWQALSLGTGVQVPGVGAGYTPAARLQGDTVRLSGIMQNGGSGGGSINAGSTWATIPAGLRPAAQCGISLPINSGSAPSYSYYGTITTGGVISVLVACPSGVNIGLDDVLFRLL